MKKIIVANLKMNFTRDEMFEYLNDIKYKISDSLEVIICPTYLYFYMFKGSDYKLGAQNVYYLNNGPYTGEVSPSQLKSLGVSYAIIGHSQRRTNFNEDDLLISKKVAATISESIKPIICIGETMEDKQMLKTPLVLKNQLLIALKDVPADDLNNIIIAYEPVWAIGSGKTPSIVEIEDVITYIKDILMKNYDIIGKVLYGGSVDKKNIKQIMGISNIDGLLIGTSALDYRYFIEILNVIE